MKKIVVVFFLIIWIFIILLSVFLLTKFKDATIELGTKEIVISEFINYGSNKGISVDLSNVNVNEVGEYHAPLKYFFINYHQKVIVKDTKAPILKTQDVYTGLGYELNVNDFIIDVNDQSEYEISISAQIDNKIYGEYPVKIIAKDKYGNTSQENNTLFIAWVKNNFSIEMGNVLKKEDLVYNKNDMNTINQSDIDLINKGNEGIYYIKSVKDNKEMEIIIEKTKDVTPPELLLKNVTIYAGKRINGINDFILKASDKVSKVSLKMLTNINYNKIGEQKIQIEASDEGDNFVVKEAVLKIIFNNF